MAADSTKNQPEVTEGSQTLSHPQAIAAEGSALSRPAEAAALKPNTASVASLDGTNPPVIVADSQAHSKESFAGFSDLASAVKAAAETQTNPKLLDELSKVDNSEVKANVAGNSSTPKDAIDRLAKDPDIKVRRAAANNDSASIDTLINLNQDPKASVRLVASITMRRMAEDTSRSTDDLAHLATSKDGDVLKALSWNKKTPADTLDFIATTMTNAAYPEQGEAARRGVAEHASTPTHTLMRLTEDESLVVKNLALRHIGEIANAPGTSDATMKELSESENPDILTVVARSRNATPEILTDLASNPNDAVRAAVLANEKTPAAAKDVVKATEEALIEHRTRAASDTSTSPKELEEIAKGDWSTNRYLDAIAKNTSTPPELLSLLANHPTESVRVNVAENSSTDGDTLRYLAHDPSVEVQARVAANTKAPPGALETLSKSPSDDTRLAVAKNESATDSALRNIAMNPQSSLEAKLAAINHPRASHDLLADVAAEDKDPSIRRAAADVLKARITSSAQSGDSSEERTPVDGRSADAVFSPQTDFKSSDQRSDAAPVQISQMVAESIATAPELRSAEQTAALREFVKSLKLDDGREGELERLTREGTRGGVMSVVALGAALASFGIAHVTEEQQTKQRTDTYGPGT